MSIKAIETMYAGCLFRSRLEARWAVFFDKLGIRWEYEAQGFECTYRLTQQAGTFRYLPDFWLPELGLYAEVKGVLTEQECVRLLDAAASLSSNGAGGCGADNDGHDVLVLGPVDENRHPWRLHMHKGGLFAFPWSADQPGGVCPPGDRLEVAADYGYASRCAVYHQGITCCDPGDREFLQSIAEQCPWTVSDIPDRLIRGKLGGIAGQHRRALISARSARFEHGQSGAVL